MSVEVKALLSRPRAARPADAGNGVTLERSPEEVEPQRTVLENGLTVLVQERSGNRPAAVVLLYRAGSLVEPPGRTGLAHLMQGPPLVPEVMTSSPRLSVTSFHSTPPRQPGQQPLGQLTFLILGSFFLQSSNL